MPPSGRREGISALSASTVAAISAADSANIARQPNASATTPATGRASRMPNSSPLMTDPTTTRPRVASGSMPATSGSSIWAATEATPISSAAPRNTAPLGARAASVSAATAQANVMVSSRRLSNRSTSGATRIESDRVSDLGERNDRRLRRPASIGEVA